MPDDASMDTAKVNLEGAAVSGRGAAVSGRGAADSGRGAIPPGRGARLGQGGAGPGRGVVAGRIVLVMHTTAYGAGAYVEAARRVGVEVVIVSDRCPILDRSWQWPDDSWVVDFYDLDAAAAVIVDGAAAAAARGTPVRAVVSVGGEVPARVAALAARRLGLPGNDPMAVAAAGNKLRLRELCAAAGVVGVPRFIAVPFDEAPERVAVRVAAEIGWPCVIKPLLLSGSRGVMRADDARTLRERFERLARLLRTPELLEMDPIAARLVLIEAFVPGPEVALEGLLFGAGLHTLAIFDKPDPLDGPFFEETIYVSPSRLPAGTQAAIEAAVVAAARALGLGSGPIHAEVRLGGVQPMVRPVVIDLAARPIGGLCSRALRFVRGAPLEELVIRQALGQEVRDLAREPPATGVMMIPIPRGGILRAVTGIDAARALPEIDDVVISIRTGEPVVPLPEGASYLGFIFARGGSPADVERTLREAHARLSFDIAPRLALAAPHGPAPVVV